MGSWKIWLILIGVLAALSVPVLAKVDASLGSGPAAPEDYFHTYGPNGNYGAARCGASSGVQVARQVGEGGRYIFTGAGADILGLGAGSPVFTYDFASGQTADDHDLLVLSGVVPEALTFERRGPHLLICGRDDAVEFVVLRQYCRGEQETAPWNNQFEEIAFPATREIWLLDELYAEWSKGDKDLFAMSRLDEIKEARAILERDADRWKIRPLSEMLPNDWFAAWACRHDLS
jgi:hypothetical protein